MMVDLQVIERLATPSRVELLKTWAQALRSEEYEQDGGNLKTLRGYCCLGVANEVCFGTTWETSQTGRDFRDDEKQRKYLGASKCSMLGLPSEIGAERARRWQRILNSHGIDNEVAPEDSSQSFLAEINDSRTPFSVIAEIIDDMVHEAERV